MLSPEQAEARRGRCGGSDVGAILGVSPWRSPFDVWAEKTGRSDRGSEPETAPQRRGRLLEGAVAQWYAEDLIVTVTQTDQQTVTGPEPWMLASPDRMVDFWPEGRWGLECKTSKGSEGWGESGSIAAGMLAGEIMPPTYALQVLWYMEVTGLPRWDVAVLFMQSDEFRRFTVLRSESDGKALVDKVRAWWQAHVVADQPPEIDGSDAAQAWLLSQFPREIRPVRQAGEDEEELLRRLAEVKAEIMHAEGQKTILEAKIKEAIADGEGLYCPAGKATWKWQAGARRLDVKRLQAEMPEVAAKYTIHGDDIRAFRFTPKKEQ
jgi:putative phage-type endonuclease